MTRTPPRSETTIVVCFLGHDIHIAIVLVVFGCHMGLSAILWSVVSYFIVKCCCAYVACSVSAHKVFRHYKSPLGVVPAEPTLLLAGPIRSNVSHRQRDVFFPRSFQARTLLCTERNTSFSFISLPMLPCLRLLVLVFAYASLYALGPKNTRYTQTTNRGGKKI